MIDVYNPQSREFEAGTGLRVLDFAASLAGNLSVSETETVFVDMCMYDVPETCIRAINVASRRFPACFFRVSGFPRPLQLVAEETGAQLVVDGTIPPIDTYSDRWPYQFLSQVLGSGLSGALVDFNPASMAEEFPSATFFKRA